jgi:hypothetical protein
LFPWYFSRYMHTAYLEAKKSIDDRSLNVHTWDAAVARATALAAARASSGDAFRIAEIGAGTGTMIERLRERGVFAALAASGITSIVYHAWELNPATASVLRTRLAEAPELGTAVVHEEDVQRAAERPFDLVIAHAVLDLFDPADAAALLDRLCSSDGLVYASVIFDGATFFDPPADADEGVITRYHGSMRQGFGRAQLRAIVDRGFSIAEAGSSDWVVPPRGSDQHADERTLVTTILDMVAHSVGNTLTHEAGQVAAEPGQPVVQPGQPVVQPATPPLSRDELAAWIALRREQLERGELMFIAHQFDVVAYR